MNVIIEGMLANVFITPAGKSKDGTKEWPERQKLQMMTKETLDNGESRMKLIDISAGDEISYKPSEGDHVALYCRLSAKGGIIYPYAMGYAEPALKAVNL